MSLKNNSDEIIDGDLLLIDSGAEYQCYASDITRTFPANGKFSKAQCDIYNLVLSAQSAAINEIKPGKHWNEPHDAAIRVLTEGMVELGVLKGDPEKLIKNDQIEFDLSISSPKKINQNFNDIKINRNSKIKVFKGPEFDCLDPISQDIIFNNEFTIGVNNRMAYNLVEIIENKIPSIISSPLMPGTIQLTPSGRVIILCRDCQTTGGYPRILQLDKKSLDCLSQKVTGEKINFYLNKSL